jgi:hypothetical protein
VRRPNEPGSAAANSSAAPSLPANNGPRSKLESRSLLGALNVDADDTASPSSPTSKSASNIPLAPIVEATGVRTKHSGLVGLVTAHHRNQPAPAHTVKPPTAEAADEKMSECDLKQQIGTTAGNKKCK